MTDRLIAHGLIDADLCLIDMDPSFAQIFDTTYEDKIGRSVLDLLHPDDRLAGEALLRWMLNGGEARHIAPRYLRSDGTEVLISFYISPLTVRGERLLAVTSSPLPAEVGTPSPIEKHWRIAYMLLNALHDGKTAFGAGLIGNPATEILLFSYVAEAEAKTIVCGELAHRIGVDWPLARRWLLALTNAAFLESEIAGPITPETPIRLTARAHAMLETIFGKLVALANDTVVRA